MHNVLNLMGHFHCVSCHLESQRTSFPLTSVIVVSIQYDEDISIRTRTTYVTSVHLDVVRCFRSWKETDVYLCGEELVTFDL